MDQRDLDVLGLHAELGLGMLGEEAAKGLAVLIGVDLRAEDVVQVLVLEHRGRNRRGDPEDLLLLLDLGRERHRMGAGEQTPSMMSTFSWPISRSTSLIAASALLCESALTGTTLYLPPTPPFSLTRSIAMSVPTEDATEPPAANGPDRS